jgi:hypothetical protein
MTPEMRNSEYGMRNEGKGLQIHRIPLNNLPSLWKREAGRDFREGCFKPLNSYHIL